MNATTVFRHAWMDLLSAMGFFLVWLLRAHFEPETLSALLLWPVLFELMLVFALALAMMGNTLGHPVVRNAWFLLVAGGYLALAWLGGSAQGLPYLGFAAMWLLLSRLKPPAGVRWLDAKHRDWLFKDTLGSLVAVWVPAFFVYLFLIVLVPGDCSTNAAGERICNSPAWIFAAAWAPYFVVEALVRGWRMARQAPSA